MPDDQDVGSHDLSNGWQVLEMKVRDVG